MNVAQIHTTYRQAGGEDRVVANEADLLRCNGHGVETVHVANPMGAVAALTLAAAPWNVRAAAMVQSRLLSPPDVVHIHNTWFALGPAIVHRLHTLAPVVMTLHNYRIGCSNALLFRDGHPCLDCVGGAGWPGVIHACYRNSRAQTAMVAITSASARRTGVWQRQVDRIRVHNPLAAEVAAASGVPEELIEVADNFTHDPGPRPAAPSSSSEVLVVGRLSWEKGLERLIRAWRNSGTELTLVIVGSGPDREDLNALAGPNVRLIGTVNPQQVTERMLRARALMFPSLVYESQPLVILEALAAGLPVIAADHPPLRWVMRDSGPDALAREAPGAWEDAIRLIEQASFVDRTSSLSRNAFEQRFSPVIAIRRLESTYAAALEHHRDHHQ